MRYKYGEVVFVSDLTPFILKKKFLIIRIRTMAFAIVLFFCSSTNSCLIPLLTTKSWLCYIAKYP